MTPTNAPNSGSGLPAPSPPEVARLKLRDDARRNAELEIELRVAVLLLRFPTWSGTAADAIRSPLDFRRLVIEIDAQRCRRWVFGDELDLFRRCLHKLQILRGEHRCPRDLRGPNESEDRP
jgi:hypothetical protein